MDRIIILIHITIITTFLSLSADEPLKKTPTINDGILRANEQVNSHTFQSHGVNNTEDILYDDKTLLEYVTAHLDTLRYISSANNNKLPIDLDVFGDFAEVGKRKIVKKYDIEIIKVKIPRVKSRWKTYYTDEFVPIYGTGTPAKTVKSSKYPYASIIIPGKPPKMKRKRVKKKKLISTKVLGHKTVKLEKKIYSPKGKHEEITYVPIFEGIRCIEIPNGWYANNAQILYTQLKAGIPATDKQHNYSIEVLTNLLKSFGLPDTTQDLAWLTALYVNLPQNDDSISKITSQLVGKLISGNVPIGDKKGLWGEVCVNPIYAQIITKLGNRYLEKHITPIEEQIANAKMMNNPKAKRKLAKLNKKLEQKMKEYDEFFDLNRQWGISMRFIANSRINFSIFPCNKNDINHQRITKAWIPGLPYDVYQYYTTDLNSTAIALFALREANLNNLLPVTISGPTYNNKPIAHSINTKSILRECFRSLEQVWKQPDLKNNPLISIVKHDECRKSNVLTRFDQTIYEKISPEPCWFNAIKNTASLAYCSEILGDHYVKKHRVIFNKNITPLIQSLRSNILNDVETFTSRESTDLHYITIILNLAPAAQNLWHEIGNHVASHINKNLDADIEYKRFPQIVRLMKEVESKAVRKDGMFAAPIDYENSLFSLYHGLCWRSALVCFIKNKPLPHTYMYWDPSTEFPLENLFIKCSTIKPNDDFHSVIVKATDPSIKEIHRIPFLYISESTTQGEFDNASAAILDYITLKGGTIVFNKNNTEITALLKSFLAKNKIIHRNSPVPRLNENYTAYLGNKDELYMIGINITPDNKKNSTKLIYQSLKAKPKKTTPFLALFDIIKGKLTLPNQ